MIRIRTLGVLFEGLPQPMLRLIFGFMLKGHTPSRAQGATIFGATNK